MNVFKVSTEELVWHPITRERFAALTQRQFRAIVP